MKIFVGIGSNMGDKEKNIRKAVGFMKEKCKIIRVSSLYETEPVGYKNQALFLNCVVQAETKLKPAELLVFFQSIEEKMGRVRKIKNGPRTIDLDILFYNDRIISQSRLRIPHPRLHERLFVLKPLREIAPGLVHPVLGKSIAQIHPSGRQKAKRIKEIGGIRKLFK